MNKSFTIFGKVCANCLLAAIIALSVITAATLIWVALL